MSSNQNLASTSLFKVNLVQQEAVKSIETYKKFVNWVSGEFDLYFQDETDFLTVYFPNGHFNIKKSLSKELTIEVKGTSAVTCNKIMTRLQVLFNNMTHKNIS